MNMHFLFVRQNEYFKNKNRQKFIKCRIPLKSEGVAEEEKNYIGKYTYRTI